MRHRCWWFQHGQHPLTVGRAELQQGRVVLANGSLPRASVDVQGRQETSGIASIGEGIEGFAEVGKGVRMVREVHLEAADVHRTHPARLLAANVCDSLVL